MRNTRQTNKKNELGEGHVFLSETRRASAYNGGGSVDQPKKMPEKKCGGEEEITKSRVPPLTTLISSSEPSSTWPHLARSFTAQWGGETNEHGQVTIYGRNLTPAHLLF
jgi:hypothetical protein